LFNTTPRALIIAAVALLPGPVLAKGPDLDAVYKTQLSVPPPTPRVSAAVQGRIMGRPFRADEAQINSCSLILKQNHQLYCKVVLNFLALQVEPADHEFFSRGKLQPRIEISQRLKNCEKMLRQTFDQAQGYALHVKLGKRYRLTKPDTTSGVINLRFANGDYLEGTFVARQASRLIWDDEMIVEPR